MNNPWPALLVGVALLGLGIGFLIWHRRSWHQQQLDPTLDDQDREYFGRQHRRRVQTSTTLAILGVLIAAGDALLPLRPQPLLTTFYWIGVLLLTGWVILLGFGDLFSTAAYAKNELQQVREKRRELERQIVEFKHRLSDEHRSGPDRPAT